MTNKIDALNTTVEIKTKGFTFTMFQTTEVPVATPFNYLETGYKEVVIGTDVTEEEQARLKKDCGLPENIEVQLALTGNYINYNEHTFTVNKDGDFMLLRLFDRNITPMLFDAYGDNDHIDIALNKHIGLLASWHETSLVPSIGNKDMGNLVYYIIIKLESIDKIKQAEEMTQRKNTSMFSRLPVLRMINEQGERSRAYMMTDIPVVTPEGFVSDGGYKEYTDVVIPATDTVARLMLNIPKGYKVTLPSTGIYDSEAKTFIRDRTGHHLLFRIVTKRACAEANNEYLTEGYLRKTLGDTVASLAEWYEIAKVPSKHRFFDKVIFYIIVEKEKFSMLQLNFDGLKAEK